MIYYIYVLQNTINNKIYIGQTINLTKRFQGHKDRSKLVRRGKRKPTPLYSSIIHHGIEKFIMIEIEQYYTQKDVDEAEEFYIEYLQSRDKNIGYNLAVGGSVNRGYKHSKEYNENMSKVKKEYFLTNSSYNKGISMTEEAKNHLKSFTGEKTSNAKFTNEQVIEIRNCYLEATYTFKEIAKQFNITSRTAYDIVHNKAYYNEFYFIPDETKQKIKLNANKKSGEAAQRKIKDELGNVFNSLKEAREFYSISYSTIFRKLQNPSTKNRGNIKKLPKFYYID